MRSDRVDTGQANPELGVSLDACGISTNLHDVGTGDPVVLVHGSGPGVTAWANWRLTIPVLAERFRVVAPDIVGFGFTERPEGITYDLPTWRAHLESVVDTLGLEQFSMVGNSFGGALALAYTIANPDRVRRLVLMGSAGLSFPITEALDFIWGYEPSVENMRRCFDYFTYDRSMASDDLARMRYEASARPGVAEAWAEMFPAPRQRWVDGLASREDDIASIQQPTLVLHGREDQVLPLSNSLRIFRLLPKAELHVFGRCGHWTQIEHAERFNLLVAQYLATGLGA